jgi:hypothetical protein
VRGNDIADKLTCTVFSSPEKNINIYILMPTDYMYIIKFLFIPLMISSNVVLYMLLYIVDLTHPALILKVYVLINYDKWM